MDWTDFFELYKILENTQNILYLGSPSVAENLAKLGKRVLLISLEEPSKKVRGLKFIKENPKNVNLKEEKFDLIFNNLPLDIIGSFTILKNFKDNLAKKGKLIMYFKIQSKQMTYAKTLSKEFFWELKVKEIKHIKLNDKFYLIAEKI